MDPPGELMSHSALNLFKPLCPVREARVSAVSYFHQQEEAESIAQEYQVCLQQESSQWNRTCMEKARQHHTSKLLSKALGGWKKYHNHFQKYKRRCREAEQVEEANWHWAVTLKAKVLHAWRLLVAEQRWKQEQTAAAARVCPDQLLRQSVSCILAYLAQMNQLTANPSQHSQEQRPRLQTVVRRCAMRWKQRALCKPNKDKSAEEQPVSSGIEASSGAEVSSGAEASSAAEVSIGGVVSSGAEVSIRVEKMSLSDAVEEESLMNMMCERLHTSKFRPQPRRIHHPPVETLLSRTGSTHDPFGANGCKIVAAKFPFTPVHQSPVPVASTVSVSESGASVADFSVRPQNKELLLPPSAFMYTGHQDMFGKNSNSGTGEASIFGISASKHGSLYPGTDDRCAADERADPIADLASEILNLQQEMKTFKQDKKQLGQWKEVKEALQTWLQSSGKDCQTERISVCRRLEKLNERIDELSADLDKRRPKLSQHKETFRHLQRALSAEQLMK